MRKVIFASAALAALSFLAWATMTDTVEDCVLKGAASASTENGAALVYRACRAKYVHGLKGEDPDNPLPGRSAK